MPANKGKGFLKYGNKSYPEEVAKAILKVMGNEKFKKVTLTKIVVSWGMTKNTINNFKRANKQIPLEKNKKC